MLTRLIGTGTTVAGLKDAMDTSSRNVREIAHRVANAATEGGAGFAAALAEAGRPDRGPEVDLEREMVHLADEQLHFEESARLLQKMYQQLRSSVRER